MPDILIVKSLIAISRTDKEASDYLETFLYGRINYYSLNERMVIFYDDCSTGQKFRNNKITRYE